MEQPRDKTETLRYLLIRFIGFLISSIILAVFISWGLKPIISWDKLTLLAKTFYFLSYSALSVSILGIILTLSGFFLVLLKNKS